METVSLLPARHHLLLRGAERAHEYLSFMDTGSDTHTALRTSTTTTTDGSTERSLKGERREGRQGWMDGWREGWMEERQGHKQRLTDLHFI